MSDHQEQTTRTYNGKKLVFKKFGDPVKVVSLEDGEVAAPYGDEVLVKMLLAPVNPADMNMIQGKYPVKPDLPATPGIEGVGEVAQVGFNVTNFGKGDLVIMNGQTVGSWSTYCLCHAVDLIKVPKKVPLEVAAGLVINTITAHRLLTDYVELGPGDTVIQNGANSACGQNIIQFCKFWGLVSVNIIRNRPKVEELKKYLTSLGAKYVFTEEELRSLDDKNVPFSRPKLALNCVGGPITGRIISTIAPGGTMVTYGGMSYSPVSIPTTAFIFQDLTFKGFWLKKWLEDYKNGSKKSLMMSELFELAEKGYLKAPAHKIVPVSRFAEALENTLSAKGLVGYKYFMDFREGSTQ